MGNLKHWDKLKTVPPDALKPITAGRLKGKSDISPQWRLEAMTEEFGVCGIGWKYEIAKTWEHTSKDDQLMIFVEINLYIFNSEKNEWSSPIPGVGGDFALKKESSGMYANDECYKMALTDALGVAMKALGVAANVYRGITNDSKHGREDFKPQRNNPPNIIVNNDEKLKKLFAIVREKSLSSDDMRGLLAWKYKIDGSAKLTIIQLDYLISNFDKVLSDYIKNSTGGRG